MNKRKKTSKNTGGKLSTEEKLQNAIDELTLQNDLMDKRAKELLVANKELAFQNKEKEKRAAELIICNKEILFQTELKAKRAEELIIANKELVFQNQEKEKRAEELIITNKELKISEDQLKEANQDLEQFTYIVSHNLRAPVANIKGLSDILGDESLSIAEAGSVVKDLLSSVTKLDSVILDLNDILQLKIDVNKAKERVVFEELVKGVKESIHSLVLREKVTIKTRFDEVPEMFTLKSYLYSIFYNLISNSIKYKRPDAPLLIEIKSFRKKETIELVFKDNGKGIDLNKSRAHVFGLYKRFHRDIEGKGMGLFMVKTQVEALGGTISIESEVNKGTTFKIIFRN